MYYTYVRLRRGKYATTRHAGTEHDMLLSCDQ